MLTVDDKESLFAFEVLFRVLLESTYPTFKVSIPFSTYDGPEPLDASITLGFLMEF